MSNAIEGPSGGWGGSEFADNPPPNARVTAVNIRSGDTVESVQMVLDSGNLPRHGGTGGTPHVFELDEGESITSIEGRYGDVVDSLTIHTSNERTSPRYGGTGGRVPYAYNPTKKDRIVGFSGRSGSEVEAIGVVLQTE